jgi:hypothetical protein
VRNPQRPYFHIWIIIPSSYCPTLKSLLSSTLAKTSPLFELDKNEAPIWWTSTCAMTFSPWALVVGAKWWTHRPSPLCEIPPHTDQIQKQDVAALTIVDITILTSWHGAVAFRARRSAPPFASCSTQIHGRGKFMARTAERIRSTLARSSTRNANNESMSYVLYFNGWPITHCTGYSNYQGHITFPIEVIARHEYFVGW